MRLIDGGACYHLQNLECNDNGDHNGNGDLDDDEKDGVVTSS